MIRFNHGWPFNQKTKKGPKFKNKKHVYDGIEFASGIEVTRYRELKLLEQARKIRNIEVHPRFELQEAIIHPYYGLKKDGSPKSSGKSHYTADFRYFDREICIIVVEELTTLRE